MRIIENPFHKGADNLIGIIVPASRLQVIADLLRKSGINPTLSKTVCHLPDAVILDVICHSEEDFQSKARIVANVMKKEEIDFCNSN